ncbi:DUF2570 domain-containing protein [Escherichia coli]|uniref:DUF2570 domain-containing protein n=1 Tax=Escherichia coli TaxID=562 RepID=UPI00202344F1|nr:DUF2570 domain-containing protein [Escherichia coli]
MKLRYKLVIVAFVVSVIGSFIWSAGHYYSKYQHEKERADEAVRNAESATAITRNVLQSLQIINTVIEAINTRLEQSARIIQRTPDEVLPALVLAATWFDNAARDADIIRRNAITHPGFVPVIPLKVPVQ